MALEQFTFEMTECSTGSLPVIKYYIHGLAARATFFFRHFKRELL